MLSAISWRSSTERRKKTYGRTTQRYSTDCLVISFIYVRGSRIQVAYQCATSRCRLAYHQCLTTPWPPTCSGALSMRCTIEAAPGYPSPWMLQSRMPSGAQAIRAPGSAEKSTGITRKQMWFRSNVLPKAPQHTARHSLQRGHKVVYYHGKGNIPCGKRTTTWCLSLQPVVPQTVIGQKR